MEDLDDLLDCEAGLFSDVGADQGATSKKLRVVFLSQLYDRSLTWTRWLREQSFDLLITAGPPSKRHKASIADIDDDELLNLAQTQGAASQSFQPHQLPPAALPGPKCAQSTAQATFDSKSAFEAAKDEESKLEELVQLANCRLASSSYVAAQQEPHLASASSSPSDDIRAGTNHIRSPGMVKASAAPSLSGADISGESVSVTTGDGRRAFCRLHNTVKTGQRPSQRQSHRPAQLLSVPIANLLQKAEQDSFDRALAESKKFSELTKAMGTDNMEDLDLLLPSSSNSQQAAQQTLWVDKYSPKSFFELLSDERINIDVVKWVKSWDAIAHRKSAIQQHGGPDPKPGPEQKLLILCGAPGVFLC